MTYAVAGVSVRRNLPFLTEAERRLLDSTEVERRARERIAEIARRMGARLPTGGAS